MVDLDIEDTKDSNSQATPDLQVRLSTDEAVYEVVPINGAGCARSTLGYPISSLADAASKSYRAEPVGVVVEIVPGDVLYVRAGSSSNHRYFKVRVARDNKMSVILEWDLIRGGDYPSPQPM